MKRFVPCFLALLLLLTACSGPEGPAGNPSGDPDPTPAAQGHALPKDNRDAAGTGAVFTDDNGWYICAAGAVSYYDYASGRTMALCAQPGCSHRRQLPGVGGECQQLRRFGRGALRHPR